MTGHTYQIDIAGTYRPLYCRGRNDIDAIRRFFRVLAVRQQTMPPGKIRLRVYRYQHAGYMWAGIDTRQPAEFWDIEPGAFTHGL